MGKGNDLLENKRKFERFDLPLIVAFKPVSDKTEYSMGLMRNFSYEGLNLVSYDSSFIPQEKIELSLRFPHSNQTVPVTGNVVWNKQTGNRYMAGISLEKTDKETRDRIMEKISSYGNIPIKKIFNSDKSTHTPKKLLERSGKSGIIKQYAKGNSVSRVTFRLQKAAAPDASNVALAGEFNNWDTTSISMERQKNGDFIATIELDRGKEYRFKYVIDGKRWENDWHADKYLPNDYGTEDSVVIV